MKPRRCEVCGEDLAGRRAHAVVCSARCRKVRFLRPPSWVEQRSAWWGLPVGDFWRTPRWLFELLDAEFRFGLDAAAAGPEDAHCACYLTPEEDALAVPWRAPTRPGERHPPAVFVNPPYSNTRGGLGAWVDKALLERAEVDVVMVLPSTRATRWALALLEHADEIRHPTRRVAFVPAPGLTPSSARGETMVAVLRRGSRGPAVDRPLPVPENVTSVPVSAVPGTVAPETVTARPCVVCGEPLEGRRPQVTTCSPVCRTAKYRAAIREERARIEAVQEGGVWEPR